MAVPNKLNETAKTVLVTVITMLVPIMAFAYGYGALTTRVTKNEEATAKNTQAVNHIDVIDNNIQHILDRLEHIDEKLE